MKGIIMGLLALLALLALANPVAASPQDVVGRVVENQITNNLQMSLEDYILLIIALGIIIFSMKDVAMGLGTGSLLYAAAMILYYESGLNYAKPFVAFMISIILLILSIMIGYQKETKIYY